MRENRVVSRKVKEKVYHHPACIHARRMKDDNKFYIASWEALRRGYRPCKCCMTLPFCYKLEKYNIDKRNEKWGMSFMMINGSLYAKTTIGRWKISYSKKKDKIILFHHDHIEEEQGDFEHQEKLKYHLQNDCPPSNSIVDLCRYIYEHDRFWEANNSGKKLSHFTSKRSKALADKVERKQRHRRIDYLFSLIEERRVQ